MRAIFDRAKVILDGEDAFLCLCIPYREARKFVGEMKARKYTVEIKEYRERRSLDANAYAWQLIGKLAAKLSTPGKPGVPGVVITPEQVYREAIRDVGDNYEVIPIRDDALDRWREIWRGKGLGWVCEVIGKSKIEGYTNTRCFYGSSVYDKAQMSRLISIIVEECKAAGVETMTPAELASLLEGERR